MSAMQLAVFSTYCMYSLQFCTRKGNKCRRRPGFSIKAAGNLKEEYKNISEHLDFYIFCFHCWCNICLIKTKTCWNHLKHALNAMLWMTFLANGVMFRPTANLELVNTMFLVILNSEILCIWKSGVLPWMCSFGSAFSPCWQNNLQLLQEGQWLVWIPCILSCPFYISNGRNRTLIMIP